MPKKTKKEKITAQYHKKLKLIESQNILHEPAKAIPNNSQNNSTNKVIHNKIIINNVLTSQEKQMVSYFHIDFKKSIFIIIFILALEFLLYFVSMYR
ncbi:MAG: hypothetical protein Q7R95_02690 [bacterium]|nr:hypothetical protein [bacterium]